MSASEEQILQALPRVRRMASRYRATSLGTQDALGVGALALVEAGRRYDPCREVPFWGFAFRRVQGAMRDACSAARGSHGGRPDAELPHDPIEMGRLFVDPLAERPDGHLDLLAALARLGTRLRRVVVLHGHGVPHHQIARELGVSEGRVSQLLTTARHRLRAETGMVGDRS
jgi:RNA polymerase sigma factor (sigma-70 family)